MEVPEGKQTWQLKELLKSFCCSASPTSVECSNNIPDVFMAGGGYNIGYKQIIAIFVVYFVSGTLQNTP